MFWSKRICQTIWQQRNSHTGIFDAGDYNVARSYFALLVKVEISIYISSSQTTHMAVMGGSQSPDFFKK